MVDKRLRAAAACCGLLILLTSPAAGSVPDNRIVNPGAEDGLAGWQGAGFASTVYDATIPRYPLPNYPYDGGFQLGAQLFATGQDAAIWQTVDFSDVAGVIDSGRQPLSWGALLGGRAGQTGAARLVVQPLDGAGAALGEPFVLGEPSDRDRQYKTQLLFCVGSAKAPVGMRAALVRLQAAGQGLADRLYLTPTAIFHTGPGAFREADGPGCHSGEQPPSPSPQPRAVPRLNSLVTMPAADRCGRGALRFSIAGNWRSNVASLRVTARGKSIIRAAGKTITVAPVRHTLRVAMRVRMRDGRERTGVQQFSGCQAS